MADGALSQGRKGLQDWNNSLAMVHSELEFIWDRRQPKGAVALLSWLHLQPEHAGWHVVAAQLTHTDRKMQSVT